MNGSHPKILRLNLGCSDHDELRTPFFSVPSSPVSEVGNLLGQRMKHSTPVGSPEENSLSSPDTVASLFLVYEQNPLFERPNKVNYSPSNKQIDFIDPITELDLDGERIVSLSPTPNSSITNNHKAVFWIPQNHSANENGQANRNLKKTHKTKQNQTHEIDSLFNSSIRKAVSLGRISSIPPPLCSLCQNKAPVFGKPPRRFNYRDLEEATDGFSDMNLVAEGGFGTVHRGVLRDGQVVAVKQLKCNGSKGDTDFCREVQVLSCAQHRNVVLLIGFCVERLSSRILVYEYICNGSLDFHLHGNKRTSLDWHARQKIAIGAARGLRYLHEDCRVGCIVHRNLRPSNILLTHDYEPLVTDFGLARLHAEWGTCDEQVVGNSGYLAPEYLNGGKITEKADIYAFGLVLVELISGQRTRDLQSYEGDFCPLSALQFGHILAADKYQWQHTILGSNQSHNFPLEVHAMGRAAFLCLQPDPESRPPMSKVLRILEEGDGVIPLGLDLNSVGSRSVRIQDLSSNKQLESTRHSRRLSH
ncbi:non-specific serine,threonine protein kinase [Sarracenia purpurea var. burkii]